MDEEESSFLSAKNKSRSIPIIILIPIVLFIATFCAIGFVSTVSFPARRTLRLLPPPPTNAATVSCRNAMNDTFICDRSDHRSDVCYMRGDVRTASSRSVVLLSNRTSSADETLRPYPRKFDPAVMDRIPELRLRTVGTAHDCDVRHGVPAVFFSAGGYTGNVFHAFADGLIPLYITSRRFDRKVVFVVSQYREWWYSKYREILEELSEYPPVDLSSDARMHCFPEATIGLRSSRVGNYTRTVLDFRRVIDNAYRKGPERRGRKPKMVFVSRTGTRAVENEEDVVGTAREVGFDVEVLRPGNAVPMRRIYRALSGCDVMIGVHGAALTHVLFVRPGSMFVQVVPIGLERLAWGCLGEMAVAAGVRYEEYRVLPRESSLYRKYGPDDPVVKEPESVMGKGWEVTKEVYLDGQNVTLDIGRIRGLLVRAFEHATEQRMFRRR